MLTVKNCKEWMEIFSQKIERNKDYLSDLDTPIGDGDHGNNMSRGMTEVMKVLSEKDFSEVSDILKSISFALISKVGGASGPLYGTAFLEMSKNAKETTEIVTLLQSGLAGVEKRGKSEPGQKTMIDLWKPAIQLLETGELSEEKLSEVTNLTKDMVAQRGRASYVGERSLGHIDPGAMSSQYLFEALLEVGAI